MVMVVTVTVTVAAAAAVAAAVQVEWDYVPSGMNQCGPSDVELTVAEQSYTTNTLGDDVSTTMANGNMNGNTNGNTMDMDMGTDENGARKRRHLGHFMPVNSGPAPTFTSTTGRIGSKYLKAIYREYTDATFSQLKPVPEGDVHKGLLGPVLRAEVGDTIEVVFRNNLDFKASMHPHGVFYPKNAEGATYNDGSKHYDKMDDKIEPGKTFTYLWTVPVRAGPTDSTASSMVWIYHSHVNEVADTYAGLVGPMVITKKGYAKSDARPKNVDKEFFAFFQIFDENKTPLFQKNIEKYLPGVDVSNLINVGPMAEMNMDMGDMDMGDMDMGGMDNGGGEDDATKMNMGGERVRQRQRARRQMEGMDKDMDRNAYMGTSNDRTDQMNGMQGMSDLMDQLMNTDDDSPMILHSHDFNRMNATRADFYESNRMYAINGYLFCNHPAMDMKVGDNVRWV